MLQRLIILKFDCRYAFRSAADGDAGPTTLLCDRIPI